MARTYIELPSSGTVDMFDDFPLSFNYSIADVRDPEKRDTTFSKTITLPGTKNNNKLFDHIFEVGKSGGFNPNVKARAIVYVDTIPVFDGYLQLTAVNITDQNEIEYDVVIFGKLANIYTVWADDYLKDIDYSELSHTYNKANITASWSATIGTGYVYPMIDYGATTALYYNVENFLPALYLKQYIDKIFAYAGYTYTSAFFNTDFFKRLIIPFNGTKLQITQQEILNRTFRATNTAEHNYVLPHGSSATLASTVAFNSLTVSPNPASQYNTGTYYWTVNKTANYEIHFDGTYDVTVNNPTGSPIVQAATTSGMGYGIEYSTNGGSTWFMLTSGFNPIAINAQTIGAAATVTVASGGLLATGMTAYLGQGTILRARVGGYDQTNASLVSTLKVNTGSIFWNRPIADITDGSYLDFNDAIPDRVRIRDLFTSVIKAFNLYVEEDKDANNNLIIEPRNDFYTNGTTYDWTDKLAIDRPTEIRPMGVLDARDYLFTYKADGDYWNERYQKGFNKIYGDRLISANNDFLVETKKTELMFSPSPMVELPQGANSNRIVPQIVQTDNLGNFSPKTANLRLLYWGGVIGTNNGWEFRSAYSGNSYYSDTYPYAGHLDHPVTPTIDLCFGVPQQLFFIPINYTNNNLYNVYYKRFLQEITDKDSKLVIMWFHLKPIDMLRLDFRNLIFVDGFYYRINKIYDYNPTADDLTKVELLKVKEGVSFVPTTGTVYTNEQTIGDEFGLGYFPVKKPNNNVWNQQSQQSVVGQNNFVDAQSINIIVSGNGNTVAANSTGVTIMNSSGVSVMPGLSNVSVFNSSGITVTQSNVVYINGVIQAFGSPSIVSVNAAYTAREQDEFILCNATSAAFQVTLPNTLPIGKVINIKKIDSSANAITIGVPGGYTIDGAGTQTLTTQYESLTLEYVYLATWFIK